MAFTLTRQKPSRPPPEDEYYGELASKASLALMEELDVDDPLACDRSLLLPAGNDLSKTDASRGRVWNIGRWVIMGYLCVIAAAVVGEKHFPSDHVTEINYWLELTAMPVLALVFAHLGLDMVYVRWQSDHYIREARKSWSDADTSVKKLSVDITDAWLYEYTQHQCDYGLAVFDPAAQLMVLEGLHYHYFIRLADVTKLEYLKDWQGTCDVNMSVMMNDVVFEIVLSRYSVFEDLPGTLRPVVTPKLVKLVRKTFGDGDVAAS